MVKQFDIQLPSRKCWRSKSEWRPGFSSPLKTRRICMRVRVHRQSDASVGCWAAPHHELRSTCDKRQATSDKLPTPCFEAETVEFKHSLLATWGFCSHYPLTEGTTIIPILKASPSLLRSLLTPGPWPHRVPSPWTGRPSSRSTARVCILFVPLLRTRSYHIVLLTAAHSHH
jgi:hypothetical protein